MNQIIAKAQIAKTAQLREMAQMLMSDTTDAAGDVLNAVLTILETRMDEAGFIAFCEELEAA